MSDKSVKKLTKKSPRIARRRHGEEIPSSSGSSPEISRTRSPAKESTRRSLFKTISPGEESESKQPTSSAKSPKSDSTTERSSPGTQSPNMDPSTKRSSSDRKSSSKESTSGRSSPMRKSPREESSTDQSPPQPESPEKETIAKRLSPRLKSPRSQSLGEAKSSRSESLSPSTESTLLSPPRAQAPLSPRKYSWDSAATSEDQSTSQSTCIRSSFEKLEDVSAAKLQEYQSAPESQGFPKKAFVFLPRSTDLDRDALKQTLTQFYDYFRTLDLTGTAELGLLRYSRQPLTSTDPTTQNPDEEMEIIIIDCPLGDDPTDAEILIQRVSNLCASASSNKPSSTKSSNRQFRFSPDVVPEGNTPDSAASGSASRGASSHSGSDFGRGKSRAKPNFRRRPEKSRLRRKISDDKDSDSSTKSSTSIKVIVLNDVAESNLAKRRLSKDKDPDATEDDKSAPKSACKKSIDDLRRSAGHMTQPLKATRYIEDSEVPSTSGYREKLPSVDSDSEIHELSSAEATVGSGATAVDRRMSEDSPPPTKIDLFADWDTTSYELRSTFRSDIDSDSQSFTLDGYYSSDSTTSSPVSFFKLCYQAFLDKFDRPSATVSDFYRNLTKYLVKHIRQAGTAPQRYFCIAGLNIWMLVRDPSGDYWFYCGGSHEPSNKKGPAKITSPRQSMSFTYDRSKPSQKKSLGGICTRAAKKVVGGARRKIRRRDTASTDVHAVTADTMRGLDRFMQMIDSCLPTRTLEPRRDFTGFTSPNIILSYEDDKPAEIVTSETEAKTSNSKPALETRPPIRGLEPRRDFTGFIRPNITVSYEDGKPAEIVTSETEAKTSNLEPALDTRPPTRGLEPRRDFTGFIRPNITVSCEDGKPAEIVTSQTEAKTSSLKPALDAPPPTRGLEPRRDFTGFPCPNITSSHEDEKPAETMKSEADVNRSDSATCLPSETIAPHQDKTGSTSPNATLSHEDEKPAEIVTSQTEAKTSSLKPALYAPPPIRGLEPRRDFTGFTCPNITVSYEDDKPVDIWSGETEAGESHLNPDADHQTGDGVHRDQESEKKD